MWINVDIYCHLYNNHANSTSYSPVSRVQNTLHSAVRDAVRPKHRKHKYQRQVLYVRLNKTVANDP